MRYKQIIACWLVCITTIQSATADILAINTFEQDVGTGSLLGSITSGSTDVILPLGSGIFIDASGQLIIDTGNLVQADALSSIGTADLSIDNATLSIGDDLVISNSGGANATLSLVNGAVLNIGGGTEAGFFGSGLTIGQGTGTGTATINNSTVLIDRNTDVGEVRLTVGRGGNGSLLIENGASVTVQDLSGEIGLLGDGVTVGEANPGLAAAGLLTVDGTGTNLTINTADLGALVAGVSANGIDSAVGVINVLNGATIDITGTGFNSGINLGRGGNSSGTVNVSGVGSTINVLGPQGVVGVAVDFGGEVGDGVGVFNISDQGVVNVNGLTPGQGFFSVGRGTGDGTLAVNTGGILNVDGAMFISTATNNNSSQSGTVNITNTGIINARQVVLGNRGAVNIDGAGSQYNIGDEILIGSGDGGISTLSVTNGASLDIGGGAESGLAGSRLAIGRGAGTGTALIDNASVNIGRNLTNGEVRLSVGRSGTGTLTIQNGATVTLQDTSGLVGFRGDGLTVGESSNGLAASGTFTITGAGSILDISSADVAFIASGIAANGVDSAVGVIDILDGAVVNVTSSAGDAAVNLARGGNSQGTLNVAGVGSTLNVRGDQGIVAVALDFFGEIGDGDGLFTVTDQAVVNINSNTPGQGFLQVGLGTGDGAVEVNTGGTINVDGLVLISDSTANNNTQTGTITVDDTGVINAIAVGVGNRGVLQGSGSVIAEQLFVFSGGTVSLDDIAGFAEINIDGGTYTTTNSFNLGQGGDQALSITAGGTFSTQGSILLGSTGSTTSINLDDPDSLFEVVGDSTVNTSIAANGGAIFRSSTGISVGAGGRIGGDGGVFETNLLSVDTGGVLAPGNSPGTLDITGDLVLNGGQLEFEIDGSQAGQFDVLNVTGNVALNAGTVGISVLDGFNPAGQNFDVLTVTGTYTQDPGVAFINLGQGPDFEFNVRNDAGVTIGSVNFISFDIGDIASLTPNQSSVALYLDRLCPQIEGLANPDAAQLDLDLRCGGIRNGANTDEQVANAVDALNPDEVFGTYNRLLNFTNIQHGNLSRRLNGLRSGAGRIDLSNVDIETEDVSISGEDLQNSLEELAGDRLDRWGFFSDGRINFGDHDDAESIPGFDFNSASLTLGTDYRFRKNLILGAALGYNQVDADFDAGGGVDISAITLSLIGTYFRGDSFYLDAIASYGWSEVDTDRRIVYEDVTGITKRRAKGSSDSSQFSAGLGTGFDFSKGRWVFGPHLGLNYSDISIDSFTEKGALGLNLDMPETAVRSMTGNVGLHISVATTPSWGVLVPYARLDYVREFKDSAETANVRFANDTFDTSIATNTPFRVTTESPDDTYMVWSVGAHAQFIRGFAAFVDYRSITGLKDMELGEVTVGMRYETKF